MWSIQSTASYEIYNYPRPVGYEFKYTFHSEAQCEGEVHVAEDIRE